MKTDQDLTDYATKSLISAENLMGKTEAKKLTFAPIKPCEVCLKDTIEQPVLTYFFHKRPYTEVKITSTVADTHIEQESTAFDFTTKDLIKKDPT